MNPRTTATTTTSVTKLEKRLNLGSLQNLQRFPWRVVAIHGHIREPHPWNETAGKRHARSLSLSPWEWLKKGDDVQERHSPRLRQQHSAHKAPLPPSQSPHAPFQCTEIFCRLVCENSADELSENQAPKAPHRMP